MFKKGCLILLLILGFIAKSDACFARTQSVAIHGKLYCFSQPATGTRLRLYDEDFPDGDDLLGSATVNKHGDFYLTGTTNEFSTMDPMLSIYHDCNDGQTPCLKRIDILIPQSFVSDHRIPQSTYEMGTINLEANFDGQSRECLD